jgi:hypothetical protein
LANEEPGRRERLTLKAVDPVTNQEIEVFVSFERLQAIGRRSKGQTLEAAELLPQALQIPKAVWEGICTESDEDKRGVGWRCYCTRPDKSYTVDGEKCPPRRGQVFLAFVNDENVAYNWRWEQADQDDPNLPRGHEIRFKRRLL